MATRLLLDTHALLWWLAGDSRLPSSIRSRIEDADAVVWASAASAWEISIKAKLGKLKIPGNLFETVQASGIGWISVEPEEAYAAGQLPMHHRDPFDRLLVVQARTRSAHLVSRDGVLDGYEVDRIWE
ncbi:MAG: type II toxin-antitoxin system VapC family toxin [Acidobacteriota bacterium]